MMSEGTRVCAFNISEVVSTLAKIAIFCFMLESKSHQSLQSSPSQPQRPLHVRQNFLSNVLLMVWLGVVLLPAASAQTPQKTPENLVQYNVFGEDKSPKQDDEELVIVYRLFQNEDKTFTVNGDKDFGFHFPGYYRAYYYKDRDNIRKAYHDFYYVELKDDITGDTDMIEFQHEGQLLEVNTEPNFHEGKSFLDLYLKKYRELKKKGTIFIISKHDLKIKGSIETDEWRRHGGSCISDGATHIVAEEPDILPSDDDE